MHGSAFFCAGVPAYARIWAGAPAQKVIAQRYFSVEWGPRQNLHMQCFGGEKRRQASLLCRRAASVATALPHAQPGIAALYLRRNPPAGKGRAEVTKKNRHLQINLNFLRHFWKKVQKDLQM